MKKNFWVSVSDVIDSSDIVLYVLDSRFPEESRNKDVERIFIKKKKKVIYVLTKRDMVRKKRVEIGRHFYPYIFVSSTDFHGIKKLKEMIIIEGKRMKKEKPKVGIVGYPNIGKSSLINAIVGRGTAKISSEPGVTKGKQNFSAGRFILIDTPGVIPRREDLGAKHVKMATSKFNSEEDLAAISLLESEKGMIERYFDVEAGHDKEETLAKIAAKKNLIGKGGQPDIKRAARMILVLYQKGRFS